MEKKKQKLSLKELCTKFIPTIKKIFSYLKKVEFNKKMKLIGELFIIIVLLCLLKLPFSIARDLIINVFFSVEIANKLLMNVLYIIFEIPYLILVIYMLMKMVVSKYENIDEIIKDVSLSIKEEPIKEEQIVLPSTNIVLEKEIVNQTINQNKGENELPSLASDTNTTESVTNNENNSNF